MAQFVVTNVVTILIPLWGMIGIWTEKFGSVSFNLFLPPIVPLTCTLGSTMSGSSGSSIILFPAVFLCPFQGIQHRVRPFPGALLRVLPDNDGRA